MLSKKRMQGAANLAWLNTSRSFFSESPKYYMFTSLSSSFSLFTVQIVIFSETYQINTRKQPTFPKISVQEISITWI